jgi:hypothetical protein
MRITALAAAHQRDAGRMHGARIERAQLQLDDDWLATARRARDEQRHGMLAALGAVAGRATDTRVVADDLPVLARERLRARPGRRDERGECARQQERGPAHAQAACRLR